MSTTPIGNSRFTILVVELRYGGRKRQKGVKFKYNLI